MITLRAAYSAELDVKRSVIIVRDRSNELNTISVTNAAESVIADLAAGMGIEGRRVVYLDTLGIWDELLHDGSRFTGYAPIRDAELKAHLVEIALERGG
jgi:hypothetical protein